MKINVKTLVESINQTFPTVKTETEFDKGFWQIVVTGESGAKVFLYPNNEAWFVKMYPSQEDYQRYAFESINEALMLN